MGDRVKFTFEFLKENNDKLKQFAERVGVTKASVINNALTLFWWAVKEVESGRIIASVDEKEKKYKELLLPILGEFATVGRTKRQDAMGGDYVEVLHEGRF